jgi:VCBS repeat-containing protein
MKHNTNPSALVAAKSSFLCTLSLAFAISGVAPSARGQAFSDNFTRGTDPGPLTPWNVQVGTWTVTGGVMRGGTNATQSYGIAYITNSWANYAVQARVKFPVGGYGGGVGGRLNTATGTRYSAWVYPENSAGGSNVLKLFKFQSYPNFGYTNISGIPMAQVNLASVGTNFHTVGMVFSGSHIAVSYDTNQVMSITDAEPQPYLSGSVSLDFWTDLSGYYMTFDDVLVTTFPPVASNDTYTATYGTTLSVAVPGVLGNDTGGNGPLTAVLVTGPTHGSFSLSTNGGFTYTATNNFTGTDTFTYRANDGQTNSGTATVTITVGPDHPPVANADNYSVIFNNTLTVSAPGVLANDTDVDGNNLTASLVSSVTNGTLNFNSNGSFTYTPAANFSGTVTFTYRASDGISNSTPATVTISVLSLTPLFSDDFTRGTDPGPIAPWIALAGVWTDTGGALVGGTNSLMSYGFAYITNSWTNYSVQARVKFPIGAYGGGLGGRLDTVGGAQYAAWIYPETSPGGSNLLRLIKFQSWTSFSYNGSFVPVDQVSLASVSTNYHSLKLAFVGNRIGIYFDGALMMSDTDTEATNLLKGAVSLGFWTDSTGSQMSADDVLVAQLVNDDTYSVNEDSTLTVNQPGVLGNDTEVYGTSLSSVVVNGPTNGTLNLSTNGSFTYTPNAGYVGSDSFTYQANDGPTNVGIARASITVLLVNHPPVLPAQTNRTINELTLLTVTNTATDIDVPAQNLTYQLLSPPAGAVIDTNGVITWTPTEAQGPGTYTITTKVTDDGPPAPASSTNSFTVTVNEVNLPPVLGTQTNRTIDELTLLVVTNAATDPDLPAQTLTYSLLSPPTGATISSAGVISWTPSEAQGPGTYTITTRVVDNGSPPLSATNSFTVTVNEVNSAPVLPLQTNRAILPSSNLVVTNTAIDTDIPANILTYTLLAAPAGASISPNGVITWTAGSDRSTNVFTTSVVDDGVPPLSATNSFTVFVNNDPVLIVSGTSLVQEGCSATNNAIDPGESVIVLFSLKNVGLGNTTNLVVSLVPSNGVAVPGPSQNYGVVVVGGAAVSQPFTFAATGACGGTLIATLQMQDGARDLGTATASFTLGGTGNIFTQNFDTVTVPALPSGWTTSATNSGANWRTTNSLADTLPNAAYSSDPASVGINELVSPALTLPLGSSQLSFRNLHSFEMGSTNGYDGGVLEIKIGTNAFVDILAAGGSFVAGGYNTTISISFSNPIAGRLAWSGTNASYITTIVDLPPSSAGQVVQFRWRVGTDNSNPGGGWHIDSIGINGALCCANSAPTLPTQVDRTVDELVTMVVTNTAADDLENTLTYQLVNPPAGAQISSSGIITWTPSEAQGPSSGNVITTIVTDNAFPPLSATNSFSVTVREVNSAPILPVQPNVTIAELSTLFVTNTATDTDIPANTLAYSLVNPPAGVTIDTNGVISWTPTEAQGPGTYSIQTIVTDNGVPPLSATNEFFVTVTEVNSAPILPVQADRTIAPLALLTVTNTATDNDIPPNILAYSLVNPPSGAAIDSNGVITWTPSASQASTTNLITTIVTDNGVPPLSATNNFNVIVGTNNTPNQPVIQSLTISNTTATIIWSSIAGQTYRLQYNADLNTTNWVDVVPDIPATNTTVTATDTIDINTPRYYRVQVLP